MLSWSRWFYVAIVDFQHSQVHRLVPDCHLHMHWSVRVCVYVWVCIFVVDCVLDKPYRLAVGRRGLHCGTLNMSVQSALPDTVSFASSLRMTAFFVSAFCFYVAPEAGEQDFLLYLSGIMTLNWIKLKGWLHLSHRDKIIKMLTFFQDYFKGVLAIYLFISALIIRKRMWDRTWHEVHDTDPTKQCLYNHIWRATYIVGNITFPLQLVRSISHPFPSRCSCEACSVHKLSTWD